jgi:hypothetical protein
MFGIGSILGAGSGILAGYGTNALMKAVLKNALTNEETQKLIIKVGILAVSVTVGGIVENQVRTTTEYVTDSIETIIGFIKSTKEDKTEEPTEE